MERLDIDTYLRQVTPFRFVDEAFYYSDTGIIRSTRKYVGDEDFFTGHFPGDPIVPGVILVESMAQSCRVWLNKLVGKQAYGFLATIDRVKFIKPVRPGDIVDIEAKPLDPILQDGATERSRFCRFSCVSRIAGHDVVKASFTLYQST